MAGAGIYDRLTDCVPDTIPGRLTCLELQIATELWNRRRLVPDPSPAWSRTHR